MPTAFPERLPTTTSVGEPDDATEALARALRSGDLCAVAGAMEEGASTNQEFTWFQRESGDGFGNLTALSLSALIDSESGVALVMPLLLARGGDIRQVDSKGRTLLHFALADPVARYLVENGVPLPEGARERILDALSHPPGQRVWDEETRLSFKNKEGHEAPVTWSMRPGAAPLASGLPVASMTVDEVRDLVRPDLVEMMEELGYFAAPGERKTDDPLYRPDGPRLVAHIPAGQEIRYALLAGDGPRTCRLIDLGGGGGHGRFKHTAVVPGHVAAHRLLTPLGLAVLRDGEEAQLKLTLLFDLEGIDVSTNGHADGGQTLLHLAVGPEICRWLLENGASPDVLNDAGELPEDVLPEASRVVIGQWRLENRLAAANLSVGKVPRL